MTREDVLNLYAGTSISEDELEGLLDSVEKYSMWGIFNGATKLATIEERDNYLLTTVKNAVATTTLKRVEVENKKYNIGLQKIDNYIKTEILPHVDSIREDSNRPIRSYNEYASKCMLKAFAIEYLLKTICIMSDIPRDEVKNFSPESYNTEQKMRSLMKDTKLKLETQIRTDDPSDTRRRSGHEIDEILNKIIPPHIRTLIKYRSIANYANADILQKGILPRKTDKSLDNFVADYMLMTRDFSTAKNPSQSSMAETAAQHNKIYHENNKAFEQYRYQDKTAGFQDYNMLNSLMVATEMTLEYLLNNRELAIKLKPGEIIGFESVSKHLTKDEYDHLIALSQKNGYDTNDLIYYHTFLKEYLEERTPRLTDERYQRINRLFEEIKNAGISSTGEKFAEWFKSFNINDLTKEELEELNVIAPEFIYNSLSYTDKLIYEKCRSNTIQYQFYYKLNPDNLDSIIKLYGEEFIGKSFGENFIRCSLDELKTIQNTLQNYNLKLSDVPDYYYKYDSKIIKVCCNKLNGGIVKEDQFQTILRTFIMESYNQTESSVSHYSSPFEVESFPIFPGTSRTGIATMISYQQEYQNMVTKKLEEVIELISEGNIHSYEELKEYPEITSELFSKAKYIADIKRLAKIEDISSYANMSIPNLSMISFKLRRQQRGDSQDKLIVDSIIPNKKQASVTLLESTPEYKNMQRMFNEIKVHPDMKFLREREALDSYNLCKEHSDFLSQPESYVKISEALLFRTPQEVKEIIDICKKKAIPTFRMEYLYFSPEEFKSNMPVLPYFVEASLNALANTNESLSYENARKNLDMCRIFNPNMQQYRPQPYERETTSNELGEMLSETSKKEGEISQTSQKK